MEDDKSDAVGSSNEQEDKKSLPAAAAASAQQESVAFTIVDDGEMARRFAAVEQLTAVFGFDPAVASQAVDTVGTDVATCCDFILEQGLGKDQGGPVNPIDTCPHMQAHIRLAMDDLPKQPHRLPCSHFQDATTTTSEAALAAPKAKEEILADGTCPLGENWLCLECGVVRCSRYVNAHGVAHWEATQQRLNNQTDDSSDSNTANEKDGHCIAVSLADLSVWCHVYRAYLRHPTALDPLVQRLEQLKFAEDADSSAAA